LDRREGLFTPFSNQTAISIIADTAGNPWIITPERVIMQWNSTHFVRKTDGDRKAMAIAAGPRGEIYYLDEREADDGYMVEKYDRKKQEWATMLGSGAS
jgi:hypothetical protein